MTLIQGGIDRQSPTAELEMIKQKRSGLQRLVKLTSTLTRLHQGLQSVMLMGKPASQMPSKIVEKFNQLQQQLEQHPTQTLQNTLSKTDIRIQQDIKHVLEISQKSDAVLSQTSGEAALSHLEGTIHEYVGDFKKKAQTSIALRITLKTRNAIIKAFKLPVPQSFIEQQINALDAREAHCRKKIEEDMNSLHSDIDSLMQKNDCSDEVKQQLLQIEQQLKSNIDHFSAGKDIDEMPIIYESIELSAPQDIIETTEASSETEKPAHDALPEQKTTLVKRSLFSRFKEWLTSPASKKWKNIDRYE